MPGVLLFGGACAHVVALFSAQGGGSQTIAVATAVPRCRSGSVAYAMLLVLSPRILG